MSSEYKKVAKQILRRKFWKLHPIPMGSDLCDIIVDIIISGNDGSGMHPYFNTSSTVDWEDGVFEYTWYNGCDTECNENGFMRHTEYFDKNGNYIEDRI